MGRGKVPARDFLLQRIEALRPGNQPRGCTRTYIAVKGGSKRAHWPQASYLLLTRAFDPYGACHATASHCTAH